MSRSRSKSFGIDREKSTASTTDPHPESVPLFMPRIGGQTFRCACGCNVFRQPKASVYECNACGSWYEGEK